jgi:predicted membrane-bound spermidine synthase
MGNVRGLAAATALFFASGATGLAYEVVWFRRFAHIWGASTLAMAAVVSSFLLGLGIGAHFLGRRADRMAAPLRGYGWCELAIGLLALLIPFECTLLAAATGALYPALSGIPLLYTLVRFLLTFLVIGPPCILMGGTFPLLVKQFTGPGDVGPTAGWLYAVNTVGAAIGCYVAGFHLLPALGLGGTNFLAASVNVAVAAGAFFLARRLAPIAVSPGAPAAPADPTATRPFALYAVAAITGFAALLLQMVWTRQLCVMLGGSTYALTSTLFVILLGIGLGSLLFRAAIPHIAHPDRAAAASLAVLIASAGLTRLLAPSLTTAVGLSKELRSLPFGNAAVCLGVSAALELLPSICMGFNFPLLVHLTRRGAADAGRAVGTVYAWNTAGSILGAAATAPVGLAFLGSAHTLGAGLSLYFVALWLLHPTRGARNLVELGLFSVLCVAGIGLGATKLDPRITDQGMFLYGYRDPEGRNVLYYKEGAACNVIVTEHFVDRALAVNGKVDATSQGDMDMQLGIAYLPRFLRPEAKNVLVIGYGSGTTSGASLLFPGTRLTCCEIEPAVFAASEHFSGVNHQPDKNPNFRIVFDDGRSHLQGTDEKYDLILSEPSNPWLAGVASLFTREFYETCRKKLGDRGILGQWIQLYSFSEAEYALVIRTVTSSFKHAALLRISSSDTVLLASDAPILPDRSAIDASQRLLDGLPEVKKDLERHLEGDNVRSVLLPRLLLDEAGLKRLAARTVSAAINTDVNLRLEFDAPLRLFNSDLNPERDVDPVIVGVVETPWLRSMIDGWGCTKAQTPALRSLAGILHQHGVTKVASDVLDLAIAADPADPGLVAERALRAKEADLVQVAIAIHEKAPDEALKIAQELYRVSKYEQAAQVYRRILEVHPRSATAWEGLGSALESLKEWGPAAEAYGKAYEIDPLNATVKKSREKFNQREKK